MTSDRDQSYPAPDPGYYSSQAEAIPPPNTEPSVYPFGEEFQYQILKLAVTTQEINQPGVFQSRYFGIGDPRLKCPREQLAEVIERFATEHHHHPDLTTMDELVRQQAEQMKPAGRHQFETEWQHIRALEVGNPKYVVEQVQNFALDRAIDLALDQADAIRENSQRRGQPVDVQAIVKLVQEAAQVGASKQDNTLTLCAPEELSVTQISYIIDRLVARGVLTLLCGKRFIGKTSLLMHQMKAIQDGTPFLNHFSTQQGTCVALFIDSPQGVVAERAKMLGLVGPHILVATRTMVPRDPRYILDALYEKVAEVRPDFVAVDALYKLLYGRDTLYNPEGMMKIMDILQLTAEDHDCAVILAHHPRKKDAGDPAGSFVIEATPQMVLDLTAPAGGIGRRLHVESNLVPEITYKLHFDGTTWLFEGADGPTETEMDAEHEAQVVRYIQAHGGETVKEIAAILKIREQTIRAIVEAQSTGLYPCLRIEKKRVGMRGPPREEWWFLPRPESPPEAGN